MSIAEIERFAADLKSNEALRAEAGKAQFRGRLRLSGAERSALGEIGHRLGRKVLHGEEVGPRQQRQVCSLRIATVVDRSGPVRPRRTRDHAGGV